MSFRYLIITTLSFVLFFAATVSAPRPARAEQDDAFDRILRAIDVVPTRQALESQWPDARQKLMDAARDDARTLYERKRALSLLSSYADDATRAFLENQAREGQADLRPFAVYTLARTFGARADAGLVDRIVELARNGDTEVREWAVRGLRWVEHESARQALVQFASHQDPTLRKIAARALRKWRGVSSQIQ